MVRRGLQILANGQHIDMVVAQITHYVQNLMRFFAQPNHQAGFGRDLRMRVLKGFEQVERMQIMSAWTGRFIQTRDRFKIVVHHIGGAAFKIDSARSKRPRKSGVRISILVEGDNALTRSMHATKCAAPPSSKSSRSTLVITTYSSLSAAIVLARLSGSLASSGSGRPCPTSQNGQRRVHLSPMIIKVAVPLPKHSPIFGQLASSHTVCSWCSRRIRLIS